MPFPSDAVLIGCEVVVAKIRSRLMEWLQKNYSCSFLLLLPLMSIYVKKVIFYFCFILWEQKAVCKIWNNKHSRWFFCLWIETIEANLIWYESCVYVSMLGPKNSSIKIGKSVS